MREGHRQEAGGPWRLQEAWESQALAGQLKRARLQPLQAFPLACPRMKVIAELHELPLCLLAELVQLVVCRPHVAAPPAAVGSGTRAGALRRLALCPRESAEPLQGRSSELSRNYPGSSAQRES